MRVNVYAEEMTDRIEIIAKEIDGHEFTGLRFYLELPVTLNPKAVETGKSAPKNQAGPFYHRQGDDDTAAITFWGKRDLRDVLRRALDLLDDHYNRQKCTLSARRLMCGPTKNGANSARLRSRMPTI
jgi:hypothetical protein